MARNTTSHLSGFRCFKDNSHPLQAAVKVTEEGRGGRKRQLGVSQVEKWSHGDWPLVESSGVRGKEGVRELS